MPAGSSVAYGLVCDVAGGGAPLVGLCYAAGWEASRLSFIQQYDAAPSGPIVGQWWSQDPANSIAQGRNVGLTYVAGFMYGTSSEGDSMLTFSPWSPVNFLAATANLPVANDPQFTWNLFSWATGTNLGFFFDPFAAQRPSPNQVDYPAALLNGGAVTLTDTSGAGTISLPFPTVPLVNWASQPVQATTGVASRRLAVLQNYDANGPPTYSTPYFLTAYVPPSNTSTIIVSAWDTLSGAKVGDTTLVLPGGAVAGDNR